MNVYFDAWKIDLRNYGFISGERGKGMRGMV
jgi:hypothetical protein